MPAQNRREWERHNEKMCLVHSYFNDGFIMNRCDEAKTPCEPGTLRMWLSDRNRLRTGKTV